ncbi:zinc finger CCCH domain-containing protein 13-like isoform X2 [Phoenix dactylifera]|uniref:Zinc finger CCCH domain-containing protein 13-like isoform X2 n=1 Tax=Phoenix dactylifera TaxID=42345 RepID=A0A8B9A4N9_PHODC|nr:zinc finger CCCH domain-containing protein 13-like isoform X2 [Phoenix dactylifera]
MSIAPKKLHEEGGHSTPLKRPLEETGIYLSAGRLIQPVGNDFCLPIEYGQDGRFAKVPRVEPRDIDKRSSQLHWMASASNSSLDHPVTSDNKLEFKNSKDAREVKTENRETKPQVRDLYADTRMDPQDRKAENHSTMDTRGDEKELKSDRGFHVEYKGDTKFNKDNYVSISSHLNWKDSKEHQRGKRYFESRNDGLDSWHAARPGLQSTDEAAKDITAGEEWDSMETHEAVGENKVDLKGEEKFRDKDRKRKDDKHRDYGEREKDRNDRRNCLQQGAASTECKEVLREERDVEKRERERKGTQKDMEWNDREKDIMKRESSNANEKEGLHYEKEFVDGSIKVSEQENTTIESKRVKVDSWKSYDRDFKERKRERDAGAGDGHGRDRCYDKESDDGCAEGEGATEKDKDVFGGVQQRRKMLRSMGTPQAPRFRSRAWDEGSQGKTEVSAIVYKAGECMQELLQSWKEFQASQHTKSDESLQNGPTLEIRIPAEYVTSTNHQVKGAQLWGTDMYTNDSDLVAVLMHTGYCCPTSSPPPPTIQELWVTVRILPPQDGYASTLRNNVRSRAWGAGIGCSFHVERCCIVKKGGGTIDLEPCLTHTSAVEPTLAPVSVERTMTTRSAASNALRQQRFAREVTVQYNLCNEPWLKYSINVVADKGLKKPLYTSARLKKGEVLYLETHFSRCTITNHCRTELIKRFGS